MVWRVPKDADDAALRMVRLGSRCSQATRDQRPCMAHAEKESQRDNRKKRNH